MRRNLLILLLGFLALASCQHKKEDYLIKVFKGEVDEIGVESGYRNSQGDTVIPLGKYYYCFTDTLRDFAIVWEKKGAAAGSLIGIDRQEKKLFDVFWFDNGPDYISEGLFRIQKNGKIGYANEKGEIIIEPQYACAFPFEQGKAKVAFTCKTIPDGEHQSWESENWLYIDTKGKEIR
jgi:hypothetical protein